MLQSEIKPNRNQHKNNRDKDKKKSEKQKQKQKETNSADQDRQYHITKYTEMCFFFAVEPILVDFTR